MPVRRSPALLVAALVAATVLLLAASTAIAIATDGDEPGAGLFVIAIALGFAGAGALIAVRRPGNPIGWMFLGTGVAAGLGTLASTYADSWIDDRSGPEALGKIAACYGSVGWIPFILVPSTFLLLLFPDGRPLSPRWRWGGWAAGVGIAASFVGNLIKPGPLEDYPKLDNPLGVEGGIADLLQGVGWLGVLVGIVASAISLVLRFRRATGDEREQLKWLAYAGALVAVTLVTSLALYDVVGSTVANVAIMTSILALPVATGIAILRHRLYDID